MGAVLRRRRAIAARLARLGRALKATTSSRLVALAHRGTANASRARAVDAVRPPASS